MKTRVTEMLGIKHPVILGAMTLVSSPPLALAVSNAGGLGIIASLGMTPQELREGIRLIREQTNKPFGVNVVAGDPRENELGEVLIEEKVPVISHGRGNPDWLIKATRVYDCINMPTVGALRHALRAEQDGADAVVVQGEEGGGHTGYIGTMVLLPLVTSRVKIPVIAAGGFCDGRGLAAALAMGAGGIYMGTRFAITQESPLHLNIKQRYLRAGAEDTMITPRITGTRCRCLRNRLVELAELEGKKVPLRQTISNVLETRRSLKIPLWKLVLGGLRMRRAYQIPLGEIGSLASVIPRVKKGVLQGDEEMGFLPSGQVCGRIDDIPTCQELIERIVAEAERVFNSIQESALS